MSDQVRVLSRRTRSSASASRGPLGLGALAVVVLIAGAAFAVGRLTDAGIASSAAHSHPTTTASGPVPTHTVDGVALGYPHSRAGAVATLLTDTQVLGDPRVLLNPARRARVLALIATPRYAATFTGSGGQALARVARQTLLGRGLATGARTVYLAVPVADRVTAYSPRSITVVGYGVSVVANNAGLTPRVTWATSTTTAVWSGGGWKLDSARSSDGPTPAPTDRPSAAAAFLGGLAGAREVHDAP